MTKRGNRAGNLGLYLYAAAAVYLGGLGLVSGDFAAVWQHVGPNTPFRAPLAYIAALVELGGGLALLWRRTAYAGAIALTALFAVFTVLWIPDALVDLGNYDPIGNVFEELSLVAGGLVLWAALSPAGSSMARREAFFAQLLGVCCISFGIVHIKDMPGLLQAIPAWLPPSRMFWAYTTTIGFFAAAAAILSGIWAPLASRLLTAEILVFEFLYWIPSLLKAPKNHFNWAGNGISVAIAGAAWVVADSICKRQKTASRASR